MKTKEYSIGDRFIYKGTLTEVVKSEATCRGCIYSDPQAPMLCNAPHFLSSCVPAFRKDRMHVQYRKVEAGADILPVKYLTRPVGQIYMDGETLVEVVEKTVPTCSECFYRESRCGDSYARHGFCTKSNRDDKKTVIFKEVKL